MKKFLLLFIYSIFFLSAYAAPFRFLPHKITQPNGEIIDCFVSGDEYFNWIHDKDGYTIIQSQDGYYYYAEKKDNKIVPSIYKVNKVKPSEQNLKKWLKISNEEYQKRKDRFKLPNLKTAGPSKAPHTGTLNNLVIYIRFKDEEGILTTRQNYDDKLNLESGVSLKSYYEEVSYNNLIINSTHYPDCAAPADTNASYEDSHLRGYFKPYNATTNDIGYKTDSEKTEREHQLLFDAVTWINANNPVDAALNIDADDDGRVDNVSFMIKGDSDGWNDLLWAHRWSLYSKTININGKRVYGYTFQPENQVAVRTLCHEMFHALGAPDLYHYDSDYKDFAPVDDWDIMEYGKGHMGAYMKWKYANQKWISSIPEITTSGTYSLNPLTSPSGNCWKIASPNSTTEFFIVEYRKKSGEFEKFIPGEGLIVYRIKSDENGNASFDNTSVFDEVYIYRPNGTVSANGIVDNAYFSSTSGRTSINDKSTNPKSFLHDGSAGGLDISNVTSADATISFDVYISDVQPPINFEAMGTLTTEIDLTWQLNEATDNVVLAWSEDGTFGAPEKGHAYTVNENMDGGGSVLFVGNAQGYTHADLTPATNYYYKIWTVNGANEYSAGVSTLGGTFCEEIIFPLEEGFNAKDISSCWSIDTIAKVDGEAENEPATITQVKSGTSPDATPNEGTHMIQFNSVANADGNIMRLTSPQFSTLGESEIKVSFAWHRDTQWPQWVDFMTLQWTTDGVNWTDGPTYNRYHTVTGWTQQSYDLPASALEMENVQVGFLFTSKYGFNCYLDKVRIGPPAAATLVGDIELSPITIYPNPSNGLFKIKAEGQFEKMTIKVRDLSGKLVYSEESINNKEFNIDLSEQAKGLYFLELRYNDKVFNEKLIVK